MKFSRNELIMLHTAITETMSSYNAEMQFADDERRKKLLQKAIDNYKKLNDKIWKSITESGSTM